MLNIGRNLHHNPSSSAGPASPLLPPHNKIQICYHPRMPRKGLFITFEGTDGVGKTTHVKRLKSWLERQGYSVTLTREPGGGSLAEKIRRLLLNPKTTISNLTELILYQAARIEHVETLIRPALKKGHIVLCDRFTDATVAYQGFARKLPLSPIHYLNKLATQGLKPDLTLLLDLPVHKGLRKAQQRHKNGHGDRLENEGLAFQNQVRKGYLFLHRSNPKRIKKIEVQKTIDETQSKIRQIVKKKLKR